MATSILLSFSRISFINKLISRKKSMTLKSLTLLILFNLIIFIAVINTISYFFIKLNSKYIIYTLHSYINTNYLF